MADIENQKEVSAPESKRQDASKSFFEEVFKDYQSRDQQTTNTTANSQVETKDQGGGNDVLEFPTIPGYDNQPLALADNITPNDAPKSPAPPDSTGKTTDLIDPKSPSETDALSNSFKPGAPGDTKAPTSSLKPLSPEDQLDDKKVSELFKGLDHPSFRERQNAQKTLTEKMFLHPDNFQKVTAHVDAMGGVNKLSPEQEKSFNQIKNHPFEGQLGVKGKPNDPRPKSIEMLEHFAKNPETLKNRIDLLSRVSDPTFERHLHSTGNDPLQLQGELKLLKQLKAETDADPQLTKDKMPEVVKRAMVLEISDPKDEGPKTKEYMDKLINESPDSIFMYAGHARLDNMAEGYLDQGGDVKQLLKLKNKLETGKISPEAMKRFNYTKDHLEDWNEKSLRTKEALGR